MRFTGYSFGSIRVDGVTYDHDLIIDRGKIRKRNKAASRKFRGAYGHTPLSAAEDIPWRCRRLVIGTGAEGGWQGWKASGERAGGRGVARAICPPPRRTPGLARTPRAPKATLIRPSGIATADRPGW